jgi:hypothetical protein
MYTQEQYIQEAIQLVSAWPEVPDEEFAEMVTQQAVLMSGCCEQFYSGNEPESPSISHR